MAERYLFLRLSSLGDIVNTLPALRALKNAKPDAIVDFVAEDRFAGLVRQVEGIDRVIEFPRRGLRWPTPAAGFRLLRHRSALRDTEYDVAIDFQGNLKGALQLAVVRARRKLGPSPAREGAHRLYREPVVLPRDIHRSCRALGLIAAAGITIDHDLAVSTLDRSLLPDFKLDRDATRAATGALGSRDTAPGTPQAAPIALLHPGSSAFGAMKRWPVASFASLAKQLTHTGADVRVTCGPGEESLAESVVTAAEGAAKFVAPLGGFAGLIALLRRAAVFIAGDSGPLHLAAALDVPCIGLFGPKDPRVYAPPWAHAKIVREPPPCSPCTLRNCGDPICMTRLPVDAVAAATLEILAAGRAR